MPDESFARERHQQSALQQLKERLRQEQLAFDPGDPEYDNYQTQLDAITEKQNALTEARNAQRAQKNIGG